jgi:hypothetical protein
LKISQLLEQVESLLTRQFRRTHASITLASGAMACGTDGIQALARDGVSRLANRCGKDCAEQRRENDESLNHMHATPLCQQPVGFRFQ